MAKPQRKPLDAGMKRTFKIMGAVVGVGLVSLAYMAYSSSNRSQEIQQSSRVGPVLGAGGQGAGQISEATRRKLDRVEAEEAQEARRSGRAYIPDMIFGEPIPINTERKVQEPAPQPREQERPPRNRYASDPLRPSLDDEVRKAQLDAIEAGLMGQVQMMISGMAPATPSVVALPLSEAAKQEQARRQQLETEMTIARAQAGQGGSGAQATEAQSKGQELIGGDEIVPAQLITPVDTDKTRFALVEVVGGPLAGAQLRGEVVPMQMSGDIEDVGLRFTSMRFDGKHYQIDAISLNEQTATDAMNGDVDRRIFSRYVMPIMMAGLSGASTYFTAKGTPRVSVASGMTGGESVIVDQERATREDAKNQGIGRAIDEAVQSADDVVTRMGNRPNQVTLDAFTPMGVMFNKPVYLIP